MIQSCGKAFGSCVCVEGVGCAGSLLWYVGLVSFQHMES